MLDVKKSIGILSKYFPFRFKMRSAVFYLTNPSPVILIDSRRMLGLDRTIQAQSQKANNSKHQDTRDLLSEIRHKKEAIEVARAHSRRLFWTQTQAKTRSRETIFSSSSP